MKTKSHPPTSLLSILTVAVAALLLQLQSTSAQFVPGSTLWLDADDAGTLTTGGGGAVSAWANKCFRIK